MTWSPRTSTSTQGLLSVDTQVRRLGWPDGERPSVRTGFRHVRRGSLRSSGEARTEPLASCPCFWFVAVGAGLGMKHGRQKSEQWRSDGEPDRSPERQWPMSRVPASTRPLS
jgi:hypothetical protein